MILFDGNTPATLCMDDREQVCVRLAAQDLTRDLVAVSGRADHRIAPLEDRAADCILIGTLQSAAVQEQLQKADVDVTEIAGRWEHYLMRVQGDVLYLIGSDERGTMWAIYECSRLILGIDPMLRWTDHPPQHRDTLRLHALNIVDGPKTYRFRGWFINDEDLITGFCRGGVPEKGYDFHKDYHKTLEMIVESALRLKQNLLIPCSHVDMDKPEQQALVELVTRRGMFISMHHQEPVGVNQQRVDQWYKARGDQTENINYVDHPHKYREIWRHFIRKWAKYPNVIWQLGLRGRGDRPVWYQNERVPDTMEARGRLISDAIQEQWQIIAEETGRTDFLSTTTLWMEGMPLYKANALTFPKGTMVILADFGPDQTWGDEYDATPRMGGTEYGVYYHVCFWGCGPHLLQGTRPEKIHWNYRHAVETGDAAYSVLNVSNIREHVRNIACVAENTWDIDQSDPAAFAQSWSATQFGPEHTAEVTALYQGYYDAFAHLSDCRIPGRMLLMDGMCKRVALMLMKIIAGEELQRVDIQNKRLFDFPNTDAFIRYYEGATAAAIPRFEGVLDGAYALLPQLPKDRQNFFLNNLIVQTETILGLYRWVCFLSRAAAQKRGQGERGEFEKQIGHAADALEHILLVRAQATTEPWAHWYKGDTLINLPDIVRMTRGMLQDANTGIHDAEF